ncbi:MAG: putative 4-hydroxybenzoate polyprenyltransferase [Spirochaetes bacterium]|jgi:4-hydroxybenzoate polyprenyltransferase|nr:putative 4-hydroxybenzoate polyprenyltransferase [Spirochaetota bacterium]
MDFKKFSEMIMIEQTLFALPFAYLGVLFAGGGGFVDWVWVTIALVAARTAGMSFNRVIDIEIDRKNPRTKDRILARGDANPAEVLVYGAAASLVLIFAAYMLNTLCFYLSFAAVALLATYSYFKRFTSSSHYYLGLVEAAAPVGGYLGVTGEFDALPFILGAAIMMWIAGLDLVYAIQDVDFDREERLYSFPARYGVERTLMASALSYVAAIAALSAAGFLARRGTGYWVAVACVAVIFTAQQRLARGEDPASAIKQFFELNRYVAPVLFIGTFLDVYIDQG